MFFKQGEGTGHTKGREESLISSNCDPKVPCTQRDRRLHRGTTVAEVGFVGERRPTSLVPNTLMTLVYMKSLCFASQLHTPSQVQPASSAISLAPR